MLAQAWISVPSTEKCSSDSSALTLGCASTARRNLAAISPSSSRSRFLVNTVTSQIASSTPEPDEPAEQQVVVQLLHQLALRAHRVERLQQQGPQQLLRRDRGPAVQRVELLELPVQRRQRGIRDRQDRPQRMARRHPALAAHIAEQPFRPPIRSAHPQPRPNLPRPIESRSGSRDQRLFPQPASALGIASTTCGGRRSVMPCRPATPSGDAS